MHLLIASIRTLSRATLCSCCTFLITSLIFWFDQSKLESGLPTNLPSISLARLWLPALLFAFPRWGQRLLTHPWPTIEPAAISLGFWPPGSALQDEIVLELGFDDNACAMSECQIPHKRTTALWDYGLWRRICWRRRTRRSVLFRKIPSCLPLRPLWHGRSEQSWEANSIFTYQHL